MDGSVIDSTLEITGSSSDHVIVNLSGVVVADRFLLSGGLADTNVVYNFSGGAAFVDSRSGNNFPEIDGIVLAPAESIVLSSTVVNGELIGGGQNLTLSSDTVISAPQMPAAPVPAAVWGGLGLMVMGAVLSRKVARSPVNGASA